MDKDRNKHVPANLYEEYTPPVFNASVSEDCPRYHGQAAADIIAVHGLASKYPRAWSIERSDGSRYYWLREKLPKDIPDARVLGYRYDSEWYENPDHTSLNEIGAQLLRCLIRDRCHPGNSTMCPTRRRRPIIFIGHSFGGLVIKQALIIAGNKRSSNSSREDSQSYRDILSAVAGVIFLGTPHRGSRFAFWADIKMGYGKLRGKSVNPELLAITKANSEVAEYIGDQFNDLYSDSRLQGVELVCYWEGKELLLPPHIVVDRHSACLDFAACRAMNANHMEMNKFHDGPGRDENYEHLLADIRMIYEKSARIVPERFNKWTYGSSAPDSKREQLLLWLSPSRKPQRTQYFDKLTTQRSAPYTCQWINSLPQFLDLTANLPSSNMLWINGKTGSGKSVLAAYLVHHFSSNGSAEAYSSAKATEVICDHIQSQRECLYKRHSSSVVFFFCGLDRANETPVNILGTLIHQLLLAHPTNKALFSMVWKLRKETTTAPTLRP